MGLGPSGGKEQASLVVTGAFTGTGQSSTGTIYGGPSAGTSGMPPIFYGPFNAVLWGTFVGSAQLECSFDGGTTWIVVSNDTAGDGAIYTAPCKLSPYEPEKGVLYRWNCTAFTSGTVNYRLSQTAYVWEMGQ